MGARRGRCYIGLSHSSGCAPLAARVAGSVWMWHNRWSGRYPGPLEGQKGETVSQLEKSDELVFGSARKKSISKQQIVQVCNEEDT